MSKLPWLVPAAEKYEIVGNEAIGQIRIRRRDGLLVNEQQLIEQLDRADMQFQLDWLKLAQSVAIKNQITPGVAMGLLLNPQNDGVLADLLGDSIQEFQKLMHSKPSNYARILGVAQIVIQSRVDPEWSLAAATPDEQNISLLEAIYAFAVNEQNGWPVATLPDPTEDWDMGKSPTGSQASNDAFLAEILTG